MHRKTKRDAPSGTRARIPTQDEGRYVSKAVRKALEALDTLRDHPDGKTMNDLAEMLDLSKTSTFRLLRTLEATGHVTQAGKGVFTLSAARALPAPDQWLSRLISVGLPHLRALSHDLLETASLAAYLGNRVEVVAVVESPHDVRMSNVVGHIVPPNASSLGKSIAAFQPPEVQEHLLRSFKIYRFTEHTITDRKVLRREYDSVRLQGFAVDREECAIGGVCFSVPVLGVSGEAAAAISISMPKTRLAEARQEEEVVAALRASAGDLARELYCQ